ncbi:helix-turn-helix domain-containing protein [uncultured Clostridium sp.]|uniref:helix-turn-helix domain-containing protein n=1 Tax=uncultured Clostridium sp. TaxID=59620 RepID=UPI0025DDBC9E|nr:helix-turn-helix domain-containing protein [uncultured Clostridium sp.]
MEEQLKKIVAILENRGIERAVMTIDEVSEYASISRTRLLEIVNVRNTDFPYFRNGKKILVNKVLLDKWLERKAEKHEVI